jgi:hypothetical protein
MKRSSPALPRNPSRPALPALALLLCALAAAAPVAAQAQRAAQSRGLWIGPIPLCAGTVAGVVVGADEVFEGQLSAVVTFRPAWRETLRRETARLVGRPMAVRLDGRILMEPFVRDPVTAGEVSLSLVTARQGARIRAAAARPCPRGRR